MLILVTGGARSGKSSFALSLAGKYPKPWLFLATAEALDSEMARRIEAHKKARPADWGLVEEPRRVVEALGAATKSAGVIVLDCITLWISNLLLSEEGFDERNAAGRAEALADAVQGSACTVILVTNEVGSGVVPETEVGRKFRDCAGRANQVLARRADEVFLMVSGISVKIKDGNHV